MLKRGQLVEWINRVGGTDAALGIIQEDEKANAYGPLNSVLVYWIDYKESSREISKYMRPVEKKKEK